MSFNFKIGKFSLILGNGLVNNENCSENLITLDESLEFQKSFQELMKDLQIPKGRYKCGEFKLRVSENLKDPNPNNWKSFVVWDVFGGVIYDSKEDFSKVVDGRMPIINDVLNRLKNIKTWEWVQD